MRNPSDWIAQWHAFISEHPELQVPYTQPSLPIIPSQNPNQLAENESFWQELSAFFPKRNAVINLNNGAVSSSPWLVQEAFTYYYQLVNQAPSYYSWKVMDQGKELVRQGIAQLLNVDSDEVCFHRNASESLNNIIFGVELQAGDQVIVCKQDYLKVVTSFRQRAEREGIELVWVDLDLPHISDEEIVEAYLSKIGPKTKLAVVTQVINWNGQVLPAKQIIDGFNKAGVEVLLDGSHALALLETDLQELNCDYYVSPLHKWLSGPITSSMMMVRKNKIARVWPLASAMQPRSEDIRKFEELSLVFSPSLLAIAWALEFHLNLGRANKEARLRNLRRFWSEQVLDLSALFWLSPNEESRLVAIMNFSMNQHSPQELEDQLLTKYQIHSGLVTWENLKGIRITPNVYTSKADLQTLVDAIKQLHSDQL